MELKRYQDYIFEIFRSCKSRMKKTQKGSDCKVGSPFSQSRVKGNFYVMACLFLWSSMKQHFQDCENEMSGNKSTQELSVESLHYLENNDSTLKSAGNKIRQGCGCESLHPSKKKQQRITEQAIPLSYPVGAIKSCLHKFQ